MDANLLLWIGQVLLALAFLGSAYSHGYLFDQSSTRPGMGWLAAVGRDRVRIICGLEVLGAFGLLVPGATGVLAWLTPVTASCFTVLMALAIVFHARRPGESQNIVLNVILAVIAILVAYGRFVVAPF